MDRIAKELLDGKHRDISSEVAVKFASRTAEEGRGNFNGYFPRPSDVGFSVVSDDVFWSAVQRLRERYNNNWISDLPELPAEVKKDREGEVYFIKDRNLVVYVRGTYKATREPEQSGNDGEIVIYSPGVRNGLGASRLASELGL